MFRKAKAPLSTVTYAMDPDYPYLSYQETSECYGIAVENLTSFLYALHTCLQIRPADWLKLSNRVSRNGIYAPQR